MAEKSVLENGVRVLSDRIDGMRSVSVGVLIDTGSKNEFPHERGYAHLIEHMLFQGTGERDAGAIAEMMQIGGGAMGAFTARDYTVYHATVLDDYMTFALEVLGDMLCNSVLAEEAIERQLSVILNEVMGDDDPLELANNLLKQTLWENHPLGYPTAGLESTIRHATQESLRSFLNRNYTANRIVVVAAGNVDHDNFAAQVRDSFWQLNRVPAEAPEDLCPPDAKHSVVIVKPRELRQVYFTMGWSAPAYISPNRYAWHVFTSLFGGGATSRLYRRLREELGVVYHASAQYHAYQHAGALVVEGATPPDTLVIAIANTLIELMKLSSEPISLDDHHRTVQSLISQHLISGDSAYVRMSRLALQELYFGNALQSDDVIRGLKSQTLENVQEVGAQICNVGIPTIALVGPISNELVNNIVNMLSDFGSVPSVVYAEELVKESI